MAILLAIHAVIEAVAAIWGSTLCCKTYCCCSCCQTDLSSGAMATGVPMQIMSGVQPFSPMQATAIVQGYNGQSQPGYAGQPVQFNSQYHIQGDLAKPAGQLTQCTVVPQNLMIVDQPMTVSAHPPTAMPVTATGYQPPPPGYKP